MGNGAGSGHQLQSPVRVLLLISVLCNAAWMATFFLMLHQSNAPGEGRELLLSQNTDQAAHKGSRSQLLALKLQGPRQRQQQLEPAQGQQQQRQYSSHQHLRQPPQEQAAALADAPLHEQQERNRQPVDVVFFWVNGSEPQFQDELRHYSPQARGIQGSTGVSDSRRFSAGRDELRYSIRALETYMPWYRHLFIVTNGQVPRWLDLSNPRVTVVPHSSLFRNADDLPTFNTNAIQSNLANIPGLSDSFIQLDDDVFLTQDISMQDFFVGPDGGQLLTGQTPTTKVKAAGNLYLQMIRSLDAVFSERLGTWNRTDPSHAPHLMQRYWLKQLQERLPDVFKRTSAARFRTPSDASLPAAYQWYVSRFQPGEHPTLPDSTFAMVDITASKVVPIANAAIKDLAARGDERSLDGSLAAQVAAATAAVEALGPGSNLKSRAQKQMAALDRVWSKPQVKVVCLQDNIDGIYEDARQLVDPVFRSFLQYRYRTPSSYELPEGQSNGCSRRLPTMAFGQLPTREDHLKACA